MKKRIFNTLFTLLLALTVYAQTPVADFSAPVVSGCAPLNVNFKDLSTGNPKYWDWDFGNGQLSNQQNPGITFSQPGTYTVKLVVRNSNGANGITKEAYITVFPSPSVSFSANMTTACLPASIEFSGNATTTEGTIAGYQWNFGDGETSTDQNPQHAYTNPGYYSVYLQATSSNGCVGTRGASRYIRVVSGIVADFSSKPIAECKAPFNVFFTNESSGPGALTYSWDFGNGNTSTDKNPATTYTSSSNYSVKLTTKSSYGCISTKDSIIPVVTYATAFTIPDSACINQQVNFQNNSAAGAVSTLWDFGDGRQSAEFSPVKTYAAANNYTVKLVNRFAECTDSVTKVIKIVKPTVDFTAANNTGCGAPLTVSFQNATPNVTAWQWDFGDGETGNVQNPVHQYLVPGKYSVKLTVTTSTGCDASITKANFVSIVPPTIAISNLPEDGCAPLSITPSATASSPDGITSYSWDFGDGTVIPGTLTPTHTYTTAGVYTITLIVTSGGGCVQPVTRLVRVGTQPSAVDFSVDIYGPCVSDSVNFAALTTGANEWLWDFGDGDSSTLQNPHHVYQDTGKLTVKLIAYNNGCAAPAVTKTDFITKTAPVAKFGATIDCNNRLGVTFSDSSLIDSNQAATYEWDFGDNQTYNGQNPGLHNYSQPGEYNTKLTVTNGPCTSVVIKKIFLDPLDGTFTVSKTQLCLNETLKLTAAEDSVRVKTYHWIIGGASFDRDKSHDTIFATADTYNITLLVTDRYNCTATSTQSIIVTKPVPLFTVGAGICGNSPVTFTDQTTSSVGIAQWQWDFGDGNTQTFTTPPFTHRYADTGSFTVKLTVKDVAGCVAEYTNAQSFTAASPRASFGVDSLSCPGATVLFSDSSEGRNLQYVWDFGNGQTSTDKSPSMNYAAGLYTVKLVVKDTVGCLDSLTRTNYINVKAPVAAFDVIDSASICGLLNSRFIINASNYQSFYLDFGDSTQSTLTTPEHFYDTYGKYTAKLFVTGYGGCVDSASHDINIYNPFAVTKINYDVPAFACNQQTVEFTIETPPGTDFMFLYGDGGIDSSGATTLEHTYAYPNNYAPYVFLKDAQDCQVNVYGNKTIAIKGAVPVFNIDQKNFCDSGSIFLTNFTISNEAVVSQVWDFGDGSTQNVKDPIPHSYTQPASYPVSLTATTQSNCMQTFTDTVRVFRTPVPVIDLSSISCINRVINFNGSLAQSDTAIQWNWAFGDGRTSAEQNNVISYDKAGNYLVTLTAANKLGCKNEDTAALVVAPLPLITTQNISIPVGGEIILPVAYSSGTVQYNWTPPDGLSCVNCSSPLAKPKVTTTYTVNVTDSNTCTNTADVTVTVVCNTENYFVPNTFSPNGDGMNDIFYPRGKGLTSVQSMKIFSRFGQSVFDRRNFTANDPSKGWDGRLGGTPAPPDVYVYIIEFVCENAQIVTMKGNITLIR